MVLDFREGVAYLNGPQQLDFEAAVVHRGLAHDYTPGYLVSNEFVIGHDQYPGRQIDGSFVGAIIQTCAATGLFMCSCFKVFNIMFVLYVLSIVLTYV